MDEEERRRVRRDAKFPQGGVELSDFSYRIQPAKIDPKEKVNLLESHEESGVLRPQPFRAAADELRRKGEDSEASALEIEWRKRAGLANRPVVLGSCPTRYQPWYRSGLYWPRRGTSAFLRWTVGYGFRPWRVLFWAVGFIIPMWIFLALMPAHAFALVPVGTGFKYAKPTWASALLCATEALLPAVHLGPVADLKPADHSAAGILVAYVQAVVSIAGWILAAALGAGIAAAIRKG
jgi:hypothetical protein